MRPFVVMPCLNEEADLLNTCRSLGFGNGRPAPADATLILVDNGSEDSTRRVMEFVQINSPPGAVVLESESERGYVPPRHKGTLSAKVAANNAGVREADVLIVQADADTQYAPNYISAMCQAAANARRGALIEATSLPTPEFAAAHPGYFALCDAADASVGSALVDHDDDVIVGDSVAAFWLSDYLAWGGHVREFDDAGDEVHAETSRLYVRGRLRGAVRVKVHSATAHPSRRKLIQNPGLFFASAGFPRERAWRDRWQHAMPQVKSMSIFEAANAAQELATEVAVRQLHMLALFRVLPDAVAVATGAKPRPEGSRFDLLVGSIADAYYSGDERSNIGAMLSACLRLIEDFPTELRTAPAIT
ncbi:MAG: glycosyltransferase [Hyphomonadaceae bacterium]